MLCMANVLRGEYLRLFSYPTDLFIAGVDFRMLSEESTSDLFKFGVDFRMLSDNCNYCIDALNEWFTVNDS